MYRVRLVVFTTLLALEVACQYIPGYAMTQIGGLVAALAWLVALGNSGKSSRFISLTLVACGSVIFFGRNVDLVRSLVAFGESGSVLMIMVLVPLVGIVIDLGGYTEALGEVTQGVSQPILFYVVAMLLAFFTGTVLLNAAIALVWSVLAPLLLRRGQDPVDPLVAALPRGFNACLMWTPAGPSVITALLVTGASWNRIAGPGMLLSAVFLVMAALVELRQPFMRHPMACEENPRRPSAQAWRKTQVLGSGLALFILAIVVLQRIGFTIYQSIVPCIFVTVLLWGFALGKPRETLSRALIYMHKRVPTLGNQFLLMTTTGFIGTALKVAFGDGIPTVLQGFRMTRMFFVPIASFLVMLLSLLGIHPVMGITVVNSLLAPLTSGATSTTMALSLLLGAALGFSISPTSATMLVTSSCAGLDSIEAGIKRHWKYALLTWALSSMVIQILPV